MGEHEATFRFYAELNDFLPPERRGAEIPYGFMVAPTAKDAIEALGVPHVEVDLIVVDGTSVGFEHRLSHGERICVYPVFESLDIGPVSKLRPIPLRQTRFVADVHLRRLARYLRLLGLDTLHSPELDDPELVEISVRDRRILLTRDRQLLKHGRLTHGYWVRSTVPVEQAAEVVRRFDVAERVEPFTRCPACNGLLRPVEKRAVADDIPAKTARWLDDYVQCTDCGKLFWQGTHHQRLLGLIERILEASR